MEKARAKARWRMEMPLRRSDAEAFTAGLFRRRLVEKFMAGRV